MVNNASSAGWISPAMLQTAPGRVPQHLKTKGELYPGLAAVWAEYCSIPLRPPCVAVRKQGVGLDFHSTCPRLLACNVGIPVPAVGQL